MGDPSSARPARGLNLLVLAELAAFWPVGAWCADRALNTPEGFWCFVPIAFALVLVWRSRDEDVQPRPLWMPIALLGLYVVAFPFVPPLIRAGLAAVALASTVSCLCRNRTFDAGIAGLLVLALPVVSALQVYAGFHLRLAAAWATAPLLRLSGFAVVAEGTALTWSGQSVLVDAPCSGIKMIWTGFFLTFALASWMKLSNARCVAAVPLALIVVLAGNVLRAAGLFYLEAGIVEGPAWMHDAIGGVTFLFVAVGMVGVIWLLSRRRACERLS